MAQVVNCDGREIKDNYKRMNSPRLAAKSHRSPDLPLSFSLFSPLFLLFPKISRTKAVISNSNHILDPALTHDRLRNSTSLVAEFDCTPHLLHSAFPLRPALRGVARFSLSNSSSVNDISLEFQERSFPFWIWPFLKS
jgi:hypothetical protein